MTAGKHSPVSDLLTLLPLPVYVQVKGEEVPLRKVRVRELSAALIATAPLLPSLATLTGPYTTETLLPLIEDRLASGEIRIAISQLLSVCSGMDEEFFFSMKTPQLAAVATAAIVLNERLFEQKKEEPQKPGSTAKKVDTSGVGLADVIHFLVHRGHSMEEVLEMDLEQLALYQDSAIREERRERVQFIEDTAAAVSALLSKKPSETLSSIKKSLMNG